LTAGHQGAKAPGVLDMRNNRIPNPVRTIHLTAVCGTGMAALAAMLKDSGYAVTGSDHNVYPPMSDFLAHKGIPVAAGYRAENLDHRPDLVVMGNAISRDNPEAVRSAELGLCFCSMPQALNRLVAAGKDPVVITGTHGKTTTAALTAWLLVKAGLDPTFMVGGILKNFGTNYRLGKGPHFVVEGDEYDTAFFDKGSKFHHFAPHTAVLTSIEFDHADIFTDLEHVKAAFRRFASAMARTSTLIAFAEDDNVVSVSASAGCRVETYGHRAEAHWRLSRVHVSPPYTHFDLSRQGALPGTFRTRLMGDHNLLNTVAAMAVADRLGIAPATVQEALETFESVRRRQEVRGCKNGITVMDDFAHHPTAVRETIRAVKPFYPEGRLLAVFEPRTNTSMRDVFQTVYPGCFDGADLVCIRKPPMLEKIPRDRRFSSEQLVADLRNRGKNAHYFRTTEEIIEFIRRQAAPGDLVLIMSNGGFDNIHARLLETL
jgi:UDP-N-acetylmuramate: L-alanyl-gamma-D-glutamyl-meso-diaminopimelate ligase